MLLSLQQADLGYRHGHPILSQVNLAVDAGDFLLLAGANGSGKSTLMRSLLGGLPLLHGKRHAAADLRLGYVPQSVELDATFPVSVTDVVSMGLWTPGKQGDRASAREAIAKQLQQVEMRAHAQRLFGSLSGGQKQRVLLARALVQEPTLLLLDEPVSGVDARATEIILGILSQEVGRGTAVVFVSHQPIALRERATRAMLVRHGVLEELPVETLCSREGLELLWT